MRTRIMSMALIAGAALTPVVGRAQSSLAFQIGGGAVAPSGDLGTYAKTGWIGHVGITKPLGRNPRIAFQASAFYAHTSHDGTAGEATNIPGVGGGLLYQLKTAATVRPYVSGLVGVLQHRYDAGSTEYGSDYGSESETKAFVGVGGGLTFHRVFVDARYVAASGTSFIPITVGMRFARAAK